MSRTAELFAIPVFLVLAMPAFLVAHGDVHQRIRDLTRRIHASGGSPELYLKRGELHRLHRDWSSAQKDYAKAESLAQGDLPALAYLRGRMWLESDQPARAVADLNDFLTREPNHVDARLVRSRALEQLDRLSEAAADLEVALKLHTRPTPEYFLERAQLLARLGKDDDAIASLKDAVQRCGPVVSLLSYWIELESSLGRYEDALARFELLPDILQSQPAWLLRRADLLVLVNRAVAARSVLLRALEGIESLPPHRAGTKQASSLLAAIQARLESLGS